DSQDSEDGDQGLHAARAGASPAGLAIVICWPRVTGGRRTATPCNGDSLPFTEKSYSANPSKARIDAYTRASVISCRPVAALPKTHWPPGSLVAWRVPRRYLSLGDNPFAVSTCA